MEYILEININTDGDFYFPYIPCGMEFFDGSGIYHLQKSYKDRDTAIEDISEICSFLKAQMRTDREWVQTDFNTRIDLFAQRLTELSPINNCISECMVGNYDETYFEFSVRPQRYIIELNLTDEEHELIRSGSKFVSIGDIKSAVLACFMNNSNQEDKQ